MLLTADIKWNLKLLVWIYDCDIDEAVACMVQSETRSLKREVYKLKLLLLEHKDCPAMTTDTVDDVYFMVCNYLILFFLLQLLDC